MTESTKQLFDGITEDDVDKVRGALARSDVDINHQQTVGIFAFFSIFVWFNIVVNSLSNVGTES